MEILSDGHKSVLYYLILFCIVIALILSKSVYFYMWCIRVSTWMHKNMFNKILYSPMRFFNQNPSGRILNRFSKDLGILDELIPLTLADTINVSNVRNIECLLYIIHNLFVDWTECSVYLHCSWNYHSMDSCTVFTNVQSLLLYAESVFGDQQRCQKD